ncbi:BACON domain-containing protein [Haloferula sp.]|uniref:BACON domain-containing protein n=1 Tax=Haloferula sp. TaxID=2497595 RepID=UPI003C760139
MKTNLISTLVAIVILSGTALGDDHGSTLATATTISQIDSPGILETAMDHDWFKLVVTNPSRHWIYTTGSTDTIARVYGSGGNQIAYSDGGGTGYNAEVELVLGVGTYYIRIEGGSSLVNTGAYKLHFRGGLSATELTEPNFSGELGENGEIDVYRLVSPSAGLDWIFTTGTTDTVMRLYDQNWNQVAYDDNGGVDSNALISGSSQAGDIQYLMIRGGSTIARMGSYTLSWRNYANAARISGDSHSGSLAIKGDLDIYQFDVTAGGRCWIFTTGTTDVIGRLYNSEGSQIAYDDNGGADGNFEISGVYSPGRYWLCVVSGSSTAQVGSYQIQIRQPSTAVNILASGSRSAVINPAGDMDLFKFSTSAGAISFFTTGTTDTFARLYNSNGTQIDYSDNFGSDLNMSISRSVTAGTYFLLVRGADEDFVTGSYGLHATFPAGSGVSSISASSSLVVGTGSTTVEITTGGSWSVSGLPAWATASLNSGTGSGNVTFSLAANLTGSPREATVMIAGVAHVLVQNPAGDFQGAAKEPALSIFPAVILAIETVNGARYRIETSDDLVEWADTGIEFIGTGVEMSVAIERKQSRAYFRADVE